MGKDAEDPGEFERAELLRLQQIFGSIKGFLYDRRDAGELTNQENKDISRAFQRAFRDAGIVGASESRIANAVTRQAIQQMRAKIVELHPEWAQSLDARIQQGGRGI